MSEVSLRACRHYDITPLRYAFAGDITLLHIMLCFRHDAGADDIIDNNAVTYDIDITIRRHIFILICHTYYFFFH